MQSVVRRKINKTLTLQGFGRHTRAEQDALAIADIETLATILGEKTFLMGEKPCGADAAVFGCDLGQIKFVLAVDSGVNTQPGGIAGLGSANR